MIRKILWAATIIVLSLIVFATLAPIDFRPDASSIRPEAGGASFDRFTAFALLGMLTCSLFPRRLGSVAASVIAIAVALELLQLIVPTRHGQALDAFVKIFGAISGVGLAAAIGFLIPKFSAD